MPRRRRARGGQVIGTYREVRTREFLKQGKSQEELAREIERLENLGVADRDYVLHDFAAPIEKKKKIERIAFWITLAIFVAPAVAAVALWGGAGFGGYLAVLIVLGVITGSSGQPTSTRRRRVRFSAGLGPFRWYF